MTVRCSPAGTVRPRNRRQLLAANLVSLLARNPSARTPWPSRRGLRSPPTPCDFFPLIRTRSVDRTPPGTSPRVLLWPREAPLSVPSPVLLPRMLLPAAAAAAGFSCTVLEPSGVPPLIGPSSLSILRAQQHQQWTQDVRCQTPEHAHVRAGLIAGGG